MWDGSKNEAGAYFLLIIKVLPSNAGGAGLIPVQDAKFPWPKSQNIKQQYYYKFNKVFKKKRKSWWGWHGGKTLWMLQTLGSPLLQYDLDLKGIIQESPTRRDIEAERTQAPPLLWRGNGHLRWTSVGQQESIPMNIIFYHRFLLWNSWVCGFVFQNSTSARCEKEMRLWKLIQFQIWWRKRAIRKLPPVPRRMGWIYHLATCLALILLQWPVDEEGACLH